MRDFLPKDNINIKQDKKVNLLDMITIWYSMLVHLLCWAVHRLGTPHLPFQQKLPLQGLLRENKFASQPMTICTVVTAPFSTPAAGPYIKKTR